MLIRITKPETKYSSRLGFIIGGVSKINKDNSFETICQGLGKPNQFGTVTSEGVYRANQIKYSDTSIVTPLVDYEVFEPTNKPSECNLLRISYYMGTQSIDVIRYVDGKTFVIDEDVYIQGGREANNGKGSMNPANDGVNLVMKYKGLYHEVKKEPRYEGERYTAIELLKDCKYEMFKLVKKVLVVSN